MTTVQVHASRFAADSLSHMNTLLSLVCKGVSQDTCVESNEIMAFIT